MYKFLFTSILISIACISMAQDISPTDEKALVKFMVSDYELIPEEGAVILIDSEELSFSEKLTADIDGVATILLPEGGKFKLKVQKFGETFDFGVLEIPVMDGPIKFNHRLRIRLVEKYVRNYTLEDVYFETGSYKLTEDSWVAMHKLLQALEFNPKMKVEIAGHTDNVGNPQANLNLSQQRANSLVDWLVNKGIARDRLIAKGYGDKEPVADNSSPEGRSRNRRTEIRIIEE